MRIAAIVLLLSLYSCSHSGKETLKIAIFRGEEFTPLAAALGNFEKEGLAVEVVELQSTSKAMEALFGGSVELVAGGFDHAIRLALEGRRAKSFAVLTIRSPLAVAVSPKATRIHRVEDLRDATVGVSAFGSSGNHFINYLLSRHGMTPDSVKIIATGGGHTVTVASAEQGRVDAIVTLPASLAILRARNPGLTVLADAATPEGTKEVFGVDQYPGVCLMAPEAWIAGHRDHAARLARAMVRTLQWVKSHNTEELQGKLRNKSGVAEELEGLRAIVAVASPDGRMPPGGAEAVRDMLAVSYPAVRSLDLTSTYTGEFLPQ